MKKLIIILLLFSCSSVNSLEVVNTSMTSVIADPHKYSGQAINIVGYLYLTQQVGVICAYKDDFLFGNGKNCFNLDSRSVHNDGWKELSEKYVNLSGTYQALKDGYYSATNGMIRNVLRLTPAEKTLVPAR